MSTINITGGSMTLPPVAKLLLPRLKPDQRQRGERAHQQNADQPKQIPHCAFLPSKVRGCGGGSFLP